MADEAEQITIVLPSFDRKVEPHGWGAKEEKTTQWTSVLAVWRGKIEGINGTPNVHVEWAYDPWRELVDIPGASIVSRTGDRIQVRVTVPALSLLRITESWQTRVNKPGALGSKINSKTTVCAITSRGLVTEGIRHLGQTYPFPCPACGHRFAVTIVRDDMMTDQDLLLGVPHQ